MVQATEEALVAAEASGSSAPAPVAASEAAPLTRRERKVAVLLARGLSNRQVAEELVITEGTARIQAERIFAKLGLRSRVQVVDWARANGLLAQTEDAVDFGVAAPQWTRMQVLAQPLNRRMPVLNTFTGQPGWVALEGVGPVLADDGLPAVPVAIVHSAVPEIVPEDPWPEATNAPCRAGPRLCA